MTACFRECVPGCDPGRVRISPKPGARDTTSPLGLGELGEPAAKSHWQGFEDGDVAPVLQQRAERVCSTKWLNIATGSLMPCMRLSPTRFGAPCLSTFGRRAPR